LIGMGTKLSTRTPASQKQVAPTPRIKPTSVVYWMRFVLAILAGLTNEMLNINQNNFGDYAAILGIGVGVAFYLLSIVLVRHVFRYGEAELRGPNRYITFGGGTFIFVWIMITVLAYTIKI